MPYHQALSVAAVSLAALLAGCSGGTGEGGTAGNVATAAVSNDAVPAENTATAGENASAATLPGGGEAIQVMLEKVATTPDQPNDQVTVSDPKFVTGIGGHFITANVRYGGGCRSHEFKAYWDGSWIKTNPPGLYITLRHNANGDTCRAVFNRVVQINISEAAMGYPEFWVRLTNIPGNRGRVNVRIR